MTTVVINGEDYLSVLDLFQYFSVITTSHSPSQNRNRISALPYKTKLKSVNGITASGETLKRIGLKPRSTFVKLSDILRGPNCYNLHLIAEQLTFHRAIPSAVPTTDEISSMISGNVPISVILSYEKGLLKAPPQSFEKFKISQKAREIKPIIVFDADNTLIASQPYPRSGSRKPRADLVMKLGSWRECYKIVDGYQQIFNDMERLGLESAIYTRGTKQHGQNVVKLFKHKMARSSSKNQIDFGIAPNPFKNFLGVTSTQDIPHIQLPGQGPPQKSLRIILDKKAACGILIDDAPFEGCCHPLQQIREKPHFYDGTHKVSSDRILTLCSIIYIATQKIALRSASIRPQETLEDFISQNEKKLESVLSAIRYDEKDLFEAALS